MTGTLVLLVIVAIAVAVRALAVRFRRSARELEVLSDRAVVVALRPRGGHVEASPIDPPTGKQAPAPISSNGNAHVR